MRYRTRVVNIRVTEGEFEEIRVRAEEHGMGVSAFLRAVGLGALRTRPLLSPRRAKRPEPPAPPPARPALRITQTRDATLAGRAYPLEGELHIGRMVPGPTPANAVALPDERVSRRHAVVRMTPKGAVVQDLSSTNGTLLKRLTRVASQKLPAGSTRRLDPGDTIIVGDTMLEYEQ